MDRPMAPELTRQQRMAEREPEDQGCEHGPREPVEGGDGKGVRPGQPAGDDKEGGKCESEHEPERGLHRKNLQHRKQAGWGRWVHGGLWFKWSVRIKAVGQALRAPSKGVRAKLATVPTDLVGSLHVSACYGI